MTTTTKELIEKLSDYMHNVWSNWYLYQRKFTNKENEIRWSNQSITKYKNLSEEDKEKDRKFAREILKLLEKHLQELPQQEVEIIKEDNKNISLRFNDCNKCWFQTVYYWYNYCPWCWAKIKRID